MVEIGKNEDWSQRERLKEIWVQDWDRVVGVEDSEQHICDANYQRSAQKHLLKTTMKISSTAKKKDAQAWRTKFEYFCGTFPKTGWSKWWQSSRGSE